MPGVAVFGVTGRMGQAILRALGEEAVPRIGARALSLTGALASTGSARLGLDASAGVPTGVRVTSSAQEALRGAAVAVDFSVAGGVADNVRACLAARVPLLVGTTGLDADARATLEAAAATLPVLIAPNTSVGVNVLAHLVRRATHALGASFDVEISEAHHRAKRDAPSGTALYLGETVAGARGQVLADVAVIHGQSTPGPRAGEAIGFAVTRGGDIVGEHTVTFAGSGERLELTHRATDRMNFARGALRAAAWLIDRPAGLYGMDHALGLDQP